MQEEDDFVEDASPPVVDGEYDERESLMHSYASKEEVIELKKQEKQHSKRIKQLKKQLERQHTEAKSEVNALKNQVQLLLAKFATKETIDEEEKEELLGDDEELGTDKDEDQFNDNDEGGEASALITTYSTTIHDTTPQNNFDINDYDDEKDAKSIASITSRRPSIRRSLIPIYDDKSDTELSFQESSYLMLMTENICTLVFLVTFSILGIAVGSLVLALVSAFDGEEGNLLNIPPDVTPQVRASQVLGAVIGILTEQDSVQGILLLRYACKSSLQIDAGEGKIKLIPPWKVILSSLSFFSVGYLFLINLVFVIVKADDVLSLFFDIVALEFVLNVDDLFFTLCKTGIFGKRLHAGSDNIDNLEVQNIPAKRSLPNRFKGCTTKILYLANFLAVFLSMTYFGIRQEQGWYGCQSVTVTYIGDEIWENAIAVVNDKPDPRVLLYSYFNGVYREDGTHDGMPRFVEQNKETDKAFESTIPSEFIYCNDLQRWIMFHPNIYKTDTDAEFKENSNTTYKTYSDSESKEGKCRNWLARSAETKSFDLTEVASQGEWDIWVGTIQKGASLSIICNECDEDLDCNFNGECKNQECVCDDDHFGQQCQYETPCEVLVTENIEKGDRTQLLLVKPDIKSRNFTTSYGRPIYTINGLSERPDALLSVGSKGHEVSQENYEDDDFFLKTTKNETKELLQYYRVTLTFSGSRWFAAINKPDFKAEIVYNSEYHAFWEETYSDSTFLVSSSTDTGTPVGVPFFSPRRRSEKNYGNKDYGAFGILLPNADIEGVGFFQCYAYSEDCVVLDISVTTQNKTLPSNIEKYSSKDQIVSWELFKGDQVEQESASVLLERDQLVHSYCLPTNVAYTFQMKDEICKSSWWDCNGPGFSGYNISVNGDLPIMEAYDAFPVSKFSFSLPPRETSDESDSVSVFCSSKPNFNVTIYTDGSPYETSWELLNSEGITLLMGGPYSYYKSFSTFNHLACLEDADGYNFTIFDSGSDGLKSPGYYDLMIGKEYIAKRAHKFDGSNSILFNLMNGTLLPESSSSLDLMPPEGQDDQYSFSNCSTVFTYISGLNYVTDDDGVSTSLFDVGKQAYVYQEEQNDPHDPKSPCLYDGVYTYTFQNHTGDCVGGDLKLLKDETNDLIIHSGSICSNDTFTFIVQDILGEVETTLQGPCMNNFHLVVPSNVTSAILWELSGSNGVILRGDKLGPLSSRLNSHRVCMNPGTYKFTTWADKSAKYSLSYGKKAMTLDLDQITPIGTAMESVDISDLTFSSTTVGDVVGNYTSDIEDDDVWIIEGSGLGVGAKMEPLGNSDSFQYVYTKFSGDFAFSVKVSTERSALGGIMFRDTLDPDSKYYSLFTGKDGLQNLYRRTCAGCETLGLTATSSSTEYVCEDSNPQVCGCASLNQTDYQGTISTTINNTECLQWDVIDNPIFYRNFPNASLGENSNYCRNPDSWDRGAWCFTSLDGSSWEECGVPICEGSLPSDDSSIWLRVVKEKDKFSSFYKEPDESGEWLQYGPQVDIRFSNPEFYVGVAVSSNNNETMEASNITISAEREQREFKFTLWDEQKVLPKDGEKFEEFGKTIAVDGNTMAVSDEDSVYVFIKVDKKWKQQDKLKASEGSMFTSTIALEGDTLAIAAIPLDEDSRDEVAGESVPPSTAPSIEGTSFNYDDNRGYVYIYTRIDGMWTPQDKLIPNEDKDIVSLELDGDRLAFGARGLSDGSVYVYTSNDGEWDKSATLMPSGQEIGFGCSLGLNGDTIVVGALYSVKDYSCELPSNTPSFPTYSPTVDGEMRMLSLETEYPTFSPTVDGESILPPTVNNESESPTPMVTDGSNGSAYVFILDNGNWTEHQILKPSNGQEDDRFGSSLALSEDTLVIGADRGSFSGVAYVYTNNKIGNWTEVAKLKPSKPDFSDEFGYSVAVNEDTIAIGAPFNDMERGSVYVFRRVNDNIWEEEDRVVQNEHPAEFGFAVSLDGNSIYVGARHDDSNDAGIGAVYELFTPLSELDNEASSLQVQSTDSPSSSPPSSSLSPSSNTTSISPNMTILESDLIDGYTFVGKGCCRNSGETLIPTNTIYEANDIEECAKACKEKYSLDDSFVGINFLSQPTWTLCNCMMDEKNNGAITYAGGCGDELCYSYNDPTISLTESGCIDVEFGFNIRSDQYPSETTWALSKVNTTEVIFRGFAEVKYTEYQYETTMCLENTQYEFTIYDSFGDGLTEGGQYNVTVGGTVIMEGGELKEFNASNIFSIPLDFTEMPSLSPSTTMLPTHQPSMSLMPSTTSSPTLSFSPSNVPSVSMAPTSCFDLDINVTSNTIWALSLVSNINGTRDELIIDNSLVKLRLNGSLYSAAIFEYSVPDENVTGKLCDCGLGMSQCDDCQEKVCLIEQGDGDFSDQISNCENGGGIAAVIYSNDVPGLVTPQYLYPTPDIPAVYISQENGHYLLNNEIGTAVDLNVDSTSSIENSPNSEESLCLSRGEYHFTYREYYCDGNCYYNITIGGDMVIQGEMQSEEEINIPFSIPFVASTIPSVSPSWAFFPSISPSMTTQPTQIPSSLPSTSPTSSLSPSQTPSIMPSIDCSDDVRAKFYIGYYYDTSWIISRIIRSNAQIVFEGKRQNSGSVYEYNDEYELCLQDGEYKFTKIGYGGSFRIVIGQTAIAQSSGEYSYDDEIVSFTIPYIGTAVPTKAPITDSPTLAPTTTAPTGSTFPTESIPLLDEFTFVGKGYCENSEGISYSCDTIYDGVNDVEACAEACKEKYPFDESFVGIIFFLNYKWCDCLLDDNGENGQITGAQSYGSDLLCYSYDDHSSSTSTYLPTTAPPSTEDRTDEPTSSSLNPLSSPPSSPSSNSPAVVAVELRTKRVRPHSIPNPVQEKKNALDE